jgi:sulfate adenylyltransferase large subunit
MAMLAAPSFSIEDFLAEECEKDLLRFTTAGSVDDGKSTLIGRLLYDTQSVYEDQVRAIAGKGSAAPQQLDFALLTDGLRAEREQGITIDVAYRHFATARRRFIIADTPGHEQYTRNMVTGASTADAAVVLIDATKGVLTQSRRHVYIASLLGVRQVLVAVNKMDLVGYDEAAFRAIERGFAVLLDQIAADTGNAVEVSFVPVVALTGDNIARHALTMPWYKGPSLLELLESLPALEDSRTAPFRFPVQRVLRSDHSFRGFAGQIASGTVRPGDRITVLPSGKSAEVARIVTYDGDLAEAVAPLSITLVLNRELDISRGDMIVSSRAQATVARNVEAALVWMDQRPLERYRRYLLKHTCQTVPAFIVSIRHRTNIDTLTHEPAETLEMNAIGSVTLQLLRPIALDPYRKNHSTGAFILIDAESNSTVAAGMISAASGVTEADALIHAHGWKPVTAGERAARWGHRGGVLELSGSAKLIDSVERSLFAAGLVLNRIEADDDIYLLHPNLLEIVIKLQIQSGLLALVVHRNESSTLVARAEGLRLSLDASDPGKALSAIDQLLQSSGIMNFSK